MRDKSKKKSAFRKEIETVKLHESIDTLKLSAFIVCSVKKDYSQLIIKGTPTQEQLQMAWLSIISEYQESRNDINAATAMEERQDKELYNNKKVRVLLLIAMLRAKYDERLADELIEEGYEYDFTEETYIDDMLKVEGELESEATYLQHSEDEANGNEPTEKGYLATLIQIQKVLRACPMLTPKQMTEQLTVREYVVYCNEYDEHIKSLTPKDTEEDD